MMPHIGGKNILRSTGEEVEIIDAEIKERGARSEEDWVTYIDSNSEEHIKEHLNLQLDFKPLINDTWNNMFDWAKGNKMPTTRNCRVFEVAKELVLKFQCNAEEAVRKATELVDEVGIETE
jgi:hypothetical protein